MVDLVAARRVAASAVCARVRLGRRQSIVVPVTAASSTYTPVAARPCINGVFAKKSSVDRELHRLRDIAAARAVRRRVSRRHRVYVMQ